jgi:hypothetical protein
MMTAPRTNSAALVRRELLTRAMLSWLGTAYKRASPAERRCTLVLMQPTPHRLAFAAGCISLLVAGAGSSSAAAAQAIKGVPSVPFAPTSIWNRPVAADAAFADVSAELHGAPASPTSVGTDLVTLCASSPRAPLTDVVLSAGWSPAARMTPTSTVLYRRHLSANACTAVQTNPFGNALFVLVDPATGLADTGVGAWRSRGGPLLSAVPDGPSAHGIDTRTGDGLSGAGRASGLPAIGGLIRTGEITQGIDHALAVNLPSGVLSAAVHWRWPASSADETATLTYFGADPALTMGSLLAVPSTVNVETIGWHTPQGRILARNAQQYGWYVADSVPGSQVQFAFETSAARHDLGLRVNPANGYETVNPRRLDASGFTADVMTILALMQAVTSNAP